MRAFLMQSCLFAFSNSLRQISFHAPRLVALKRQ
nr:MAG TPA: hypothetical protein [Caudoviricetes sp.]